MEKLTLEQRNYLTAMYRSLLHVDNGIILWHSGTVLLTVGVLRRKLSRILEMNGYQKRQSTMLNRLANDGRIRRYMSMNGYTI